MSEEYREIIKKEKEAMKFLKEVGKEVFSYLGGTVNKATIEALKKSRKDLWPQIKEKAEEYFHEIDRYLSPEISKKDPQFYKLLAKAKENLMKITQS